MGTRNKTTEQILMMLLKEPFTRHTATSLAKSLNITRQGLWKSLNKLAESKLIVLEPIGNTKKSAVTVRVEWSLVVIKTLSLLLTKESLEYERWMVNFAELENYASFVILFGSILHNSKKANDIDILVIVSNKHNFKQVDESTSKIQKTQAKKIHLIELTDKEFMKGLKSRNKAYLDALKKGVVLFGQDNYTKFVEETTKA